jgi:hypothetical protein
MDLDRRRIARPVSAFGVTVVWMHGLTVVTPKIDKSQLSKIEKNDICYHYFIGSNNDIFRQQMTPPENNNTVVGGVSEQIQTRYATRRRIQTVPILLLVQ